MNPSNDSTQQTSVPTAACEASSSMQTAVPMSSENPSVDDSPLPLLKFSDAAASKVKELVDDEGNPDLMLRVYISGGGCSGFQYGFTFTETQADDDWVIENQGMKLLVDSMSYQYLEGATIDYQEDVQGSRFVILNPNAKSTCGCGSSFSMADQAGDAASDEDDLF